MIRLDKKQQKGGQWDLIVEEWDAYWNDCMKVISLSLLGWAGEHVGELVLGVDTVFLASGAA